MSSEFEKIWPWIRDCAYDVGFTKDNLFVGQAMFIENFTASFTVALNVMIDNGLIKELEKESLKRISAGESGGEVTAGVVEIIPLRNFTLTSVLASKGAPECSCSGISLPKNTVSDLSAIRRFDFSEIRLDLPATISAEVPTHTFFFQHRVLSSAQGILECACYRFSEKHYPPILTRNKWRCPEAGELTAWTKELIRSFEADPEPVAKAVHNPARFPKVLGGLAELRHTTVHRVQVSSEKLLGLLKHAFDAVKMFKDNKAINDIALLFHGHGDCLTLGQKIKSSRTDMLNELMIELERVKAMLKACEDLAKRTSTSVGEYLKWGEQSDTKYECFLEDQLDWMCKGSSRKPLGMMISEYWEQMSDEHVDQMPAFGDPLAFSDGPVPSKINDPIPTKISDGW